MGAETIAALAVISAVGNIKANRDQARAERENADFLREEAAFAVEAGERESFLFQRDAAEIRGEQVGAFAKAGISFEGSALLALKDTDEQIIGEIAAIKRDTEFRERLALLKAGAAEKRASSLTSPLSTLLAIGGPAARGTVQRQRLRVGGSGA